MPLMRQLWGPMAALLLLASAAGISVGALTTRDELRQQMRSEDGRIARSLALALSQQGGDAARMQPLVDAQFEESRRRLVRVVLDGAGAPAVVRERPDRPMRAPGWFAALLAVDPGVASASVTAAIGETRDVPRALAARAIGRVEVASRTGPTIDLLWRATVRLAAAQALLLALAGGTALGLAGRARRPLDAVAAQAEAMAEGRFLVMPESSDPVLRRLTRAMNATVTRLKGLAEAQAAQVEQLRRQAQYDPLTGVANRLQFLAQLRAALDGEDGPAEGGLVILRVGELASLNRALGHATVDRLLCAVAQVLQPYADGVPGCFAGRLNGADFALCMPVGGVAAETAQALAGVLRTALPAFGAGIGAVLGAVELQRGMPVAQVMAAADAALARAESRGAYAVESGPALAAGERPEAADPDAGLGESAWRERIAGALEHDRLALAAFPLLDAGRGVVHLECMLRLQLREGGAFESAARWLPHAARSRLTAVLDERAVALALRAITADGVERAINLSPLSLRDSGYAGRLRALLFAAPPAARKLWLEVPEAAAAEQIALVRELGRQLRPCGVRWGCEHAGARHGRIDPMPDAGFDYVKLDASLTQGVGSDESRAGFLCGTVEMLHHLSLKVYAEGVADAADAEALLTCGIDGVTGPWASGERADLVSEPV